MKIEKYFKNSPVFQLVHSGRLLEKYINQSLASFGLSYFQALLLITLYVEARDDILLGELVDIFPLTKGAVSQIISRLEAEKLLRRRSSKDRRSSWIGISKKGSELVIKLMARLEEHEREFDQLLDLELSKKYRDLQEKTKAK